MHEIVNYLSLSFNFMNSILALINFLKIAITKAYFISQALLGITNLPGHPEDHHIERTHRQMVFLHHIHITQLEVFHAP